MTRCEVFSATFPRPFRTRPTVAVPTPASSAISLDRGGLGCRSPIKRLSVRIKGQDLRHSGDTRRSSGLISLGPSAGSHNIKYNKKTTSGESREPRNKVLPKPSDIGARRFRVDDQIRSI